MSADGGDGVEPLDFKRCACGRQHSFAAWLSLRLCGYVGKRVTGGEWEAVELRHCPCGSTIGVVVRWQPNAIQEDEP